MALGYLTARLSSPTWSHLMLFAACSKKLDHKLTSQPILKCLEAAILGLPLEADRFHWQEHGAENAK